MAEPQVKIDPETLKEQITPLSVEQEEAIQEEALKELAREEETPEQYPQLLSQAAVRRGPASEPAPQRVKGVSP